MSKYIKSTAGEFETSRTRNRPSLSSVSEIKRPTGLAAPTTVTDSPSTRPAARSPHTPARKHGPIRLRAGGVLTKASLNAHWTEAAAPHITSPMTCIRPKSIPWRYPCRTCGCLRPFTSTTCQTDTLQLAQIDLPAVSRSCAGAVGGQEPLAMWTCCTPWVTVDVGRGLCAGFISCPRTKPGPLL
jgi:hypothetical protein